LKMNKIQKTHSAWNWKILRMAFSKNSKIKYDPKTSKTQKVKQF